MRPIKNLTNMINYKQNKQPADRHIYERGCLRAGEDWLESHLLQVVGTTLSAMLLQVLQQYD